MTFPTLHTLHRADGSTTYTSPTGHTVLCAVNAPVEVQRRDELPEEAFIEVNIRPHNGVGQVKERHLEMLVADTLRSMILVGTFPRQMVQVTMQVLSVPEDEDVVGRTGGQGESYLPILSSLLNSACLALLDAAVPMKSTFMASVVAITDKGQVVQNAGFNDVNRAKSLHVLAFSSKVELLLAESEGRFSMDQWSQVHELAKQLCFEGSERGDDVDMLGNDGDRCKSLQNMLRERIEQKVMVDQRFEDG